ncbi:MAG TPA: hypothetical protein EYQ42_06590 [Thiotrichaceae bacterium]|jgi:hypothetical protein|nr:hypothetical protein [Thiotrichaceae bacterium]HIM08452.1 hypothetical protein [Gammaproteobacteria bacterium]
MSEEVEVKKNNKLTIVMVVLMFTSPLILSWYVFNYTDFLEMRGMSNNGQLIDPPRPLGDLTLLDPFKNDRKDSLFGKWSLAYVAANCNKACMDNVYLMRQTHVSMDKHSLRVQKVLLLTEQPVGELKELLADFKGQQIINNDLIDVDELLNKFRLNESDKPLDAHRLYIIDPLGNLMMSYELGANPRDIYKDLKKLLRGSRIG